MNKSYPQRHHLRWAVSGRSHRYFDLIPWRRHSDPDLRASRPITNHRARQRSVRDEVPWPLHPPIPTDPINIIQAQPRRRTPAARPPGPKEGRQHQPQARAWCLAGTVGPVVPCCVGVARADLAAVRPKGDMVELREADARRYWGNSMMRMQFLMLRSMETGASLAEAREHVAATRSPTPIGTCLRDARTPTGWMRRDRSDALQKAR
jgi:hypothetical protein